MKTRIITIALITFTSITSQLFAQETATLKTRTKSNQTNERTAGYDVKKASKLRVLPTETGCSIVFDNIGGITGGVVAGKKGYDYYQNSSSFSVSSADNSVSIVSPRDAASGLPTGKRSGMGAGKATFKEFTVSKRCDGKTTKISCPDGECEIPLDDCPNGTCDLVCSWSWGASQQGTSMSSSGSARFSLEIQDGACTAMAINEKGLPGEKKPNTSTTNNPK